MTIIFSKKKETVKKGGYIWICNGFRWVMTHFWGGDGWWWICFGYCAVTTLSSEDNGIAFTN